MTDSGAQSDKFKSEKVNGITLEDFRRGSFLVGAQKCGGNPATAIGLGLWLKELIGKAHTSKGHESNKINLCPIILTRSHLTLYIQ